MARRPVSRVERLVGRERPTERMVPGLRPRGLDEGNTIKRAQVRARAEAADTLMGSRRL